MTVTNLDYWLRNDPDPIGTIKIIKDKIALKKRLASEDPIALMKMEMDKAEWDTYWSEKRALEAEYLHSRGFAKKERDQFDMKHVAMIPQCVYNHDVEYWQNIIKSRQFYKHPYFLVSKA
jgi:hypothetical protein